MLAFRSRPKHLELRRTSSCSSLPINNHKKSDILAPAVGIAFCCVTGSKGPRGKSEPFTGPIITLQPVQEGIEHISQLIEGEPICHFCEDKDHTHSISRLKIFSRGSEAHILRLIKIPILIVTFLLLITGLVRSRDGSRLSPNTQAYISLPSPNIQSAKVKSLFGLYLVISIYLDGANV